MIPLTFYMLVKYAIIDAIMGTGKTHEINRLINALRADTSRSWRILVITFRVSLAVQMADRFNMQCYKVPPQLEESTRGAQRELDACIRRDEYDELVICINSVGKLGPKKWDFVIADECGLMRLHTLSSITTPHLNTIMPEMKKLVRAADHVVLSQEFVAEKDVEFYMGLDEASVYDATKVDAFRFVRPVKIHPIEHSTSFFASVHKMLECYELSFDFETNTCVKPFMVFVPRVSVAEFLVHILQKRCRDLFKDDEAAREKNVNRIKGLWRALRSKSEFC